jgi:hypothetical protein
MNQILTGKEGVSSYQSWLRETNPELYNWSQTYNPYDYNPYIDPNTGEIKNTNIGSFRTMVGLTSSDQTYSFIERYGGLTEKELNNMFDDFYTDINNISTKNFDKASADLDVIVTDIKNLTDKLGMSEDVEKAIGGWDNLKNEISNYANNVINSVSNEDTWAGVTQGLIAGATIGAAGGFIGSGIGLLIGAAGGLIGAAVGAGRTAEKKRAAQDAAIANAKNSYTQAITMLIEYAKSERRKKQIEFNNNNR